MNKFHFPFPLKYFFPSRTKISLLLSLIKSTQDYFIYLISTCYCIYLSTCSSKVALKLLVHRLITVQALKKNDWNSSSSYVPYGNYGNDGSLHHVLSFVYCHIQDFM